MCDAYAEVAEHREQKASKDYDCASCHRPIPAGSLYVRTFALFEGEPYTSREHLECRDLVSRMRDRDGCEMICPLSDAPEFIEVATPMQALEFERLTGHAWWGEVTS